MLIRTLSLVALVATAACGPLASAKQDGDKQAPARATDDALAATGKADPITQDEPQPTDQGSDQGDDDSPSKHDQDDDQPKQSPTQSPFQGDLPDLTIEAVTTSGAGCTPGDVAVNVSSDAKAFTVLFSDFIAELSSDATPGKDGIARASRQCRLALALKVPHGYRVTVMTMDYRGFVDLQDEAKASLKSSVGFAGKTPQTFTHAFTGPTSEDVAIRDTLNLTTTAWSACGGNATLNVDVKASVSAPAGATALLALDSADGELTQKYGLAWQRCH